MKKHKVNILFFLIFIYILSISNLLFPQKTSAIESENRDLNEKPVFTIENLFSGNYFNEYDIYFSDNFIFRKSFINFSKRIKHARGIYNEDAAEIVVFEGLNVADNFNDKENSNEREDMDISHKSKEINTEKVTDTSDESKATNIKKESITVDEKLIAGTNIGKILIVGNSAMEINTYNEVATKNYVKSINYISEIVDESVKTYSILVPTQIEFIHKQKYKNISYSQKDCIDYVNNSFNSLVTSIDVYKTLKEHKDEYIYFRTDHHWTPLGAYYAYREFIQSTGEKPLNLNEFEKSEIEGFLGTLYNVTLSEQISITPDTVEVYTTNIKHDFWVYYDDEIYMGNTVDIKFMNEKNKYSVYLSGDHPLGKITTEIKNDKKIVVIKDSYANSFIPFLIPHYEEIYIVDPRMYEGNIFDLIKENNIDEILFLNYVLVNRYDGYSKLFMKIAGE